MNDENKEVVTPEVTEEVAPEANPEAPEEESAEELKARLAKAEELANNYKIRAEKAEKSVKQPVKAPVVDGLSTKDTIAIMNAKVHEDDIDEVADYAKFKGISVSEALKSDVIKSSLGIRAEQRKVAEATNIAPSRRSNAKVSDEALLSEARSGKLPESDEEIARLVAAQKRAVQNS